MNGVFQVEYAPGNLTAVAHDKDGKMLASFTRLTPSGAASLKLSLDAPSPLTGTGSALVADGEDTAMVRASLLDKGGELAVEPGLRLIHQVLERRDLPLGVPESLVGLLTLRDVLLEIGH